MNLLDGEGLRDKSAVIEDQLNLPGLRLFLAKLQSCILLFLLFAGICTILLFTSQNTAKAEESVSLPDKSQALNGLGSFVKEANPFCFKAYWDDGLRLDSLNEDIRIKIGGRLQADAGNIWANDNLLDAFTGIAGGEAQLRRLRVSLLADFYERVEVKLEVDFSDRPILTDGYIELKKIPYVGHFRVGHSKEPFSLEELTSSNNITFMERSLPTDVFSPGRNIGFELHNTELHERITWALGGFWDTGAIDDSNSFKDAIANASGYNVTARATGLPWFEDNGQKLLHLGLGYSHKSRTTDNFGLATGPESNLIEDRLVDTGKFPADDADLIDSELAFVQGPFSLQGEIFQAFTAGAEDHLFWGYYVYLSYFLTGECRPYDKSQGIFSTLKPRSDFKFSNGQWGAWELALRHSYVDLNDGDVEGGKESNFTAGLNWYLNPNVRLMLNYIHARIDDRASPEINNGIANIVQGRFQIFF